MTMGDVRVTEDVVQFDNGVLFHASPMVSGPEPFAGSSGARTSPLRGHFTLILNLDPPLEPALGWWTSIRRTSCRVNHL